MAARASDSLQTYRRRRDFAKTPEPAPDAGAKAGDRPVFVVQRHEATRLHYDFRLEWGGVLKSWAVPRGPSHDPAVKRLAVQTEDHPLGYATFEGDIPKGEYGGGHVDVWDHGTWQPEGDPERAWKAGRLTFTLDGGRLHGRWHLVRTRGGKGAQQWLLMKSRDEYAVDGDDAESDRAAGATAARRGPHDAGAPRTGRRAAPKPRRRPPADRSRSSPAADAGPSGAARAKRARPTRNLPDFVEPQLATLATAAPAGTDWWYELKLDGYRILARVDGTDVRLMTRNRQDWTAKMPRLRDALASLGLRGTWLDGELIAPDDAGRASFQKLQQTLGADDAALQYWIFDAPFLGGEDLRATPLRERKARLEAALRGHDDGMLRYSRHLEGVPAELWSNACELGFEGLILKDPDARYSAGRTASWLKLKCRSEQEFVIGGYSVLADGRPDVSNIILGYYDGDELRFAGKVGTGFSLADARALKARFARARRPSSPFAERVPVRGHETVTWLEPVNVAQVAFAGWTADAHVRAPVFLGLREDKEAKAVKRETAKAVAGRASTGPARRASKAPVRRATSAGAKDTAAQDTTRPESGTRARSTGKRGAAAVATRKAAGAKGAAPRPAASDARLTHPDRVLYPDDGVTKRELADYFSKVAPRLLPHLANRPLSVLRATDGDRPFFQKHQTGDPPPGIETVCIDVGSGGRRDYFVCADERGLASLAQLGAVELHTWGSVRPQPLRPDRLTFDLDPDPALDWRTVADAALVVRALLQDLGLESFCKTTGGKGLHVVAPLTGRRTDWDTARAWARTVADFVARGLPDRFTSTSGARNREGKIFVDYLRNYVGATAVAAWSPRLRAGVPVSMPIAWREVEGREDLRGTRFSLRGLMTGKLPHDAWAKYSDVVQVLDPKALAKLGGEATGPSRRRARSRT
jgi:bifunctional non-homologous end joining protein LigD